MNHKVTHWFLFGYKLLDLETLVLTYLSHYLLWNNASDVTYGWYYCCEWHSIRGINHFFPPLLSQRSLHCNDTKLNECERGSSKSCKVCALRKFDPEYENSKIRSVMAGGDVSWWHRIFGLIQSLPSCFLIFNACLHACVFASHLLLKVVRGNVSATISAL